MTVEEPAGPELVPAPCRASAAAPCEVESRLRDALPPQAAPLDTSAPSASWADWFGDRACRPVPSTGDGVDATPRSGSGAGTLRATACSAADLAVARLGLGAALNLRFRGLASLTEGPCELVLQVDAERGLSLDEQRTLRDDSRKTVAARSDARAPESAATTRPDWWANTHRFP